MSEQVHEQGVARQLYNSHRAIARQRAVGIRILKLVEAAAAYEAAVNEFGVPSDPNRSTIITFASGRSGAISMIKESGDVGFVPRGMGTQEIDGLSTVIERYDTNIAAAAADFAENELDYKQRAIGEAEFAGVRITYDLGDK